MQSNISQDMRPDSREDQKTQMDRQLKSLKSRAIKSVLKKPEASMSEQARNSAKQLQITAAEHQSPSRASGTRTIQGGDENRLVLLPNNEKKKIIEEGDFILDDMQIPKEGVYMDKVQEKR